MASMINKTYNSNAILRLSADWRTRSHHPVKDEQAPKSIYQDALNYKVIGEEK